MVNKKKAQKTKSSVKTRRFTKPVHLLCRLFIVFFAALATVIYTDKKLYFITDQRDPHHEQRWESVYEITPHHPIDIVVLGNSHVNTGIEPSTLSCILGCTAFDMAPSGITIADSYYCLKELLTRTTPRLVVIETYLMRGTEGPVLEGAALADEFRSFYPRRNMRIKLESLPILFGVESYLPAWSFTLRNHELLLRNREEIEKNRDLYEKRHSKKDKDLYLGRFARFTKGINDSIMHLYETKGPAVDGKDEKISGRDIKYAQKIVDLCNEKGIQVMFLTLPMYEYHIGDYDSWRQEQAKAINPTEKPWFNLQMPYLSDFDSDCFEPTYSKNQHMTIYGSIKATYKLAHYIADNMKVDLPDRRNESEWMDMFYGKDGFYENLSPKGNDTVYSVIAQDTILQGEHIIDLSQNRKNGWIYLKIDRNSTLPDNVYMIAEVLVDGEPTIGRIETAVSKLYDPVHHKLYSTLLPENVKVRKLYDFEIIRP